MTDLKNLEEVIQMLDVQEKMMDILEEQQTQIETQQEIIISLKEQLTISTDLNKQLEIQLAESRTQIAVLQKQNRELQRCRK